LGNAINLVSPQESKGLEFDAVIVIEPEDIVAGDAHGHRLLYVALTRTVGYLDVVCAGEPLPLKPIDPRPLPGEHVGPPMPPLDASGITRLANDVATRLRRQSPPAQWDDVLREATRLLEPPQ
jgi:superfamily I DNA/RNA helicase